MPFSKNTYYIKVYFEFDYLDFFHPFLLSQPKSRSIFASPTEKSFPRIKVYFEFDYLDCYPPIFTSPTEKSTAIPDVDIFAV